MGFGIELLVVLLMFFGGSRRDLLDLIPTDSYWQAKHVSVTLDQLERDAGPDEKPTGVDALLADLKSPEFKTRAKAKKELESLGFAILPQLKDALNSTDPEVKAVAAGLIKEFEGHIKERAVRRLMAIRTIGEHKEKDALPLLKGLADSKEMFVSDYAARATAQIQGKPWTPTDHAKEVQQDVQLLPSHTGIVGQCLGLATEPITIEALIDSAEAAPPQNGGIVGSPDVKMPPKPELMLRATTAMLGIIERIGNVRIDGLTVGVSDDAGEQTGFAILIVHGQFDVAALLDSAKATLPSDDSTKFSKEDGINIVRTEDMALMSPSNQQLILVMADEEKDRNKRITELSAALKKGKGDLNENIELANLMKTIDVTAPIWMAGKLNTEERTAKEFEAFNTITLVGQHTKDGISITIKGGGEDPEKVKASADELNTDLQTALTDLKAEGRPAAPIADLLQSVKISSDGKNATVTGEIKSGIAESIFGGIGPLMVTELLPPEPPATQPQH